jgi:hypothetical protein
MWLDIDEAAALIGLSRRHFRRKYINGENEQGLRIRGHLFPGSKQKRLRFLRADVERLKGSIAA